MHGAAIWWELASRARSLADSMNDLAERRALLDVVTEYERQARGTVFPGTEPDWLGAPAYRVW